MDQKHLMLLKADCLNNLSLLMAATGVENEIFKRIKQ
jgi:hypothetical protein